MMDFPTIDTDRTDIFTSQYISRNQNLSESKDLTRLKKATEDFEGIFVKMMLDSMRKTVQESGLFPKNSGQEFFEDMMYQTYSEKIVQTGNLGLAKNLYNQLSKYHSSIALDV
jgi:flagellar protein FlgJ